MAGQGERPSWWRRIRAALTREQEPDIVVSSPPATEADIRRVEELDAKYGWEQFREKR